MGDAFDTLKPQNIELFTKIEGMVKMDKEFSQQGYRVENSKSIVELNSNATSNLCSLLKISQSSSQEEIENTLAELFKKNVDRYTGLLKAFANTPDITKYSTNDDVIELVKKCGVANPSLVTPPILHIVSEKLILNRAKVFTPPHQDVISTKGSVGQVVVWIPLHAITPENYGICAWKGSHRNGLLESSYSEFGHTVVPNLVPNEPSTYITMDNGDICVFSQYLIHETCTFGNFRMAVSFRFNDASDSSWADRNYFVPFTRTEDKTFYEDLRQEAPKKVQHYFI
jgi:hypothetical protein